MQVSELIEEIKRSLDIPSDVELSKRLGVAPITIASWKRRNSIGTLIEHMLANKIPVSIDSLLGGQHAHATGSFAVGVVRGDIKNKTGEAGGGTELEKQLEIAKLVTAANSEKLEELVALLRDFNKKAI